MKHLIERLEDLTEARTWPKKTASTSEQKKARSPSGLSDKEVAKMLKKGVQLEPYPGRMDTVERVGPRDVVPGPYGPDLGTWVDFKKSGVVFMPDRDLKK